MPGPLQQLKSLATRERVIRTAIECIAEGGLEQATAARLAARAGVSWGGIQHQFGDKAAIFDAVLEHLLETFTVELSGISASRASLSARIAALVEGTWLLICNPAYQAFREILLHHRPPTRSALSPERIMGRVNQALDAVCAGLFGDLALPRATVDLIKLTVFATLGGMAEQRRIVALPMAATRLQLELLERTIKDLIRRNRRPR
ncbi:MAG: TetR/AcrR family transcriptional regulator [Myxococcota bacterium]